MLSTLGPHGTPMMAHQHLPDKRIAAQSSLPKDDFGSSWPRPSRAEISVSCVAVYLTTQSVALTPRENDFRSFVVVVFWVFMISDASEIIMCSLDGSNT